MLLALLERLHRALEHIHVQGEADFLDVAALLVPEQLPGTANFEVVGGEHESGTEFLRVGDGVRVACSASADMALSMRRQQVGIGLVVGAAHAAAQLVQLGQAELVGALDDDGVGGGDVDTGLDDGGAHQDIEFLVVEVAHHLLQLALAHLAVADGDARLRHQLAARSRAVRSMVLDVVVDEVDLAAAQQLAAAGPP